MAIVTCWCWLIPGDTEVKEGGAGTQSGRGTRRRRAPGAAAAEWRWGCVPPLRRPGTPCCWSANAAAGNDAA